MGERQEYPMSSLKASEVLPRIFEPFFTTKAVGPRNRIRSLYRVQHCARTLGKNTGSNRQKGGVRFLVQLG